MCDCARVCASPRWPRSSRKSPRPQPPPDVPKAERAGSVLRRGNKFRLFAERTVYRGGGKPAWLAHRELNCCVGRSCYLEGSTLGVRHTTPLRRFAHLPALTCFIPTMDVPSWCSCRNSQGWLLSSPYTRAQASTVCVCVLFRYLVQPPSLAAHSFWAVPACGNTVFINNSFRRCLSLLFFFPFLLKWVTLFPSSFLAILLFFSFFPLFC